MRAGMTLEALAQRFDVQLFVVPVAGGAERPSDFVLQHTNRVHSLDLETHLDPYYALIQRLKDADRRREAEALYPKPSLSRYCTGASARFLKDWAGPELPAALHVMRLYLAPFAEPFLRLQLPERPICVLDVDDDEVQTRRRLSDLHHRRGERLEAAREASEEGKYAAFAANFFPAFDRVTAASVLDVDALGRRHRGGRFAHLPNGYACLDKPLPRKPAVDGKLRLIFVGTLDYLPNRDAVEFLCSGVREALRRQAGRGVEIDIVGACTPAMQDRWAEDPEITLHGFVDRPTPHYAAADVAIVPLRAGGGTRIKILEAFAHGVPVVSTSVGAEGLDVIDGEHLVIGDDAESLAAACWGVKFNPARARALADRGTRLLTRSYGATSIATAVGAIYD